METEKRIEEQREFGVFFDDDYNYLQHLKEPSRPSELVPSYPLRLDAKIVDLRDEGEEEDEEQEEVGEMDQSRTVCCGEHNPCCFLEAWLQ